MTRRSLGFLAALLLLLSGCGSAAPPRSAGTPAATGTPILGHGPQPITDPALGGSVTYVVTAVSGTGARTIVAGSQIRFAFAKGLMTITAGCNTMSGTYAADGTQLRISSLATTDMGCPGALGAQDSWLAGLFAQPVRFTTGPGYALTATDAQRRDVLFTLVPRQLVSPDVSLSGTHWVLDTIIQGHVASSVPSGGQGALQINGSRYTYLDGCNGGGGTVAITATDLAFTPGPATQMACRGTAVVANAFRTVITGTATYKITEGSLRITNGDHGLGFRAVRAAR